MRVGPVVDLASLPNDNVALKDIVFQVCGWNERLLAEVFRLRRQTYGRKSERLPDGQTIFDWYGTVVQDPLSAPEKPEPPETEDGKKKGHGRRVIPPELVRQVVFHDLPEREKDCGRCGKRMRAFDFEVSEQLEVEPARLFVLSHVRPKYGCPDDDCKGTIRIAPPATSPIERGLAGPGLIAHTIVEKFDDHLPCYRQSERWARQGIEVARSTLGDWLRDSGGLLQPIAQVLKEDVLRSHVVNTDDTPVKVLVPGLDHAHQAYLWAYVGDGDHPSVYFEFTMTRQQEYPMAVLRDYEGFLQCDAYKGYDQLFLDPRKKKSEVGCNAHVRRRFYDAQEVDPKRALLVIGWYRLLYAVEEQARTMLPEDRHRLRQQKARPVMDRFKEWLEAEAPRVLPKSPMGEAIGYARRLGPALDRYLENPALSIDNNKVERILRSPATGRKNWLFMGREGGGETASIHFSIVESCKLAGVNPYLYLKDVLVRISTHPAARILELLPRCWKPPDSS
jgi:transposase